MPSPFDRLMDTARPHMPGAIDQAIKQELFHVCKDFFNRTNSWMDHFEYVLPAGQNSYTVTPVTGRCNRLMQVNTVADRRGILNAYMLLRTPTVVVPWFASADTGLIATIAMLPNDPLDAGSFPIVPVQLVEKYTDELMSGLLARMMMQPSKPYTNLQLARYHQSVFIGGSSRVKNDVMTASTMDSTRWYFPSF